MNDVLRVAVVGLGGMGRALPVLCEKPLTTTVDDAASVLHHERAAGAGRRLVQVGYMRRFDPAFAAVRDDVTTGRTGPPRWCTRFTATR